MNTAQNNLGIQLLSIICTMLFLGVLVVNALANILPINGVNTGTLSDEIPNLFVPAGLTFSIWGLIYLLLLGHCGALLAQAFGKRNSGLWTTADGLLLATNFLANAAWILCWHYRMVSWSLIVMVVIFATLIALEERNFHRSALGTGRVMAFLLRTPINVYLGWICIATIANVTAVLVTLGWNGFGLDPRFWTVAVIAAGLAVGLGLIFRRRAIAAPLVIVWAFVGIVIKRLQTDADTTQAIWISAAAAALIVVVVLVLRLTHLIKRQRQ